MNKLPPQQQESDLHSPVLLNDVLTLTDPKRGESYLDLTAGYGGHAKAVINKIGSAKLATLVDRDEFAISSLKGRGLGDARIIKSDYASAAESLAAEGDRFDIILIDLGVSSPQLDNAGRGFSFKRSGPLDMRMDQTAELTAEQLVNTAPMQELMRIIRDYGEEPKAAKIAAAIVNARPLKTTAQLADVVASTHRGRWSKTHPATRTFQALRIAVNDELGQLSRTLNLLPELLNEGGRVAIISFHSLEDRLVKRFFKDQIESGYEAEFEPITKKPISGAINDVNNPRSRSAKLRVAAKIKTKRR